MYYYIYKKKPTVFWVLFIGQIKTFEKKINNLLKCINDYIIVCILECKKL